MGTELVTSQGEIETESLPAIADSSRQLDLESARISYQIQSGMLLAKRFPRDEMQCVNKVVGVCKSRTFCEKAKYAYKRGNQIVSGLSVHAVLELARIYKNVYSGWSEVERRPGESSLMAFAADLESNVLVSRGWINEHLRSKREGPEPLVDPRDIYEHNANMGARRLRACMQQVIPRYLQELMSDEVDKTLSTSSEPLPARIKRCTEKFAVLGVTTGMLEAFLQHNLAATREPELLNLIRVYQSIKDGIETVETWFGESTPVAGTVTDRLAGPRRKAKSQKAESPAPAVEELKEVPEESPTETEESSDEHVALQYTPEALRNALARATTHEEVERVGTRFAGYADQQTMDAIFVACDERAAELANRAA